jgi:hypothetical protein
VLYKAGEAVELMVEALLYKAEVAALIPDCVLEFFNRIFLDSNEHH